MNPEPPSPNHPNLRDFAVLSRNRMCYFSLYAMRFTPVFKIVLGVFALTAVGISESKCQEGEPIPENELTSFLGPVRPEQITWRMVRGPDFTVYYGTANPPLAGTAGFYVGGWPQKVEPGQVTFRSRLGHFPVEWHRTVNNDGSIRQEAIARIDSAFKGHVWANAPNQTEMTRLLAVLGQLPTFAHGHLPERYRELQAEFDQEERVAWLIWIGWSAVVGAAAWLVDRMGRRREFSIPGRWLTFAATILAAIAITFGGLELATRIPFGPDQLAINVAISWYYKAQGFLLLTAAAAVACLALLIALGLMLVWRFRRASRSKSLAAR
jgi:hypothetical protein